MKILLLLCLLITLSACETKAEITSPLKYNKHGVSFDYPSNWKISDDNFKKDVHFLTIETTGDAVFLIQIYKESEALALKDYALLISASIAKSMPIGEMKTKSMNAIKIMTKNGEIEGLQENISLTLLGQNIPYIRKYYSITQANKVAFLISNVTTDQQKYSNIGFDLIVKSLHLL
ncbi:MAG: hypothetical protein KAH22_08500 [Thiotrichaceae bacterium]|nr:hypothetical protein [Thiotrichaceae bacterium]